MGGLFGGCGCNSGRHGGFGGALFGGRRNGCDHNCGDYDDQCNEHHGSCGTDCCSIILILLLLTSCCGCEIDWCNIIVLYLLLSAC